MTMPSLIVCRMPRVRYISYVYGFIRIVPKV
jgi:hypothetical protein